MLVDMSSNEAQSFLGQLAGCMSSNVIVHVHEHTYTYTYTYT